MRCLFANSFQLFADMAKRRLLGRRPRGPRFSESMGVLLVALASFSYTAAQAQDPSKTWDTLTEAVQRLYKEGKFKDALDAAVQREKFASATLGETSAKYAESLNDLGLLQKTLGNFVEAEKNYRRAIDIDRVASGPNHPFVAKKLNTLGNLLRETGRSDGAIPVFLEAIKIGETQPKTDRSELASWYGNLANTYYGLALYSLSESNFKTALELSAIVDGPRHENRARYLNNYSNVLLKQGRFSEAEQAIKESLDIDIEKRGPTDPLIAFDLTSLGQVYRERGLYQQALEPLQSALKLRIDHYTGTHPFVAASMTSLATVLRPLGRVQEAEKLYLQAIEIDRAALLPNHPAFAEDLSRLGTFYLRTGRANLAVRYLEESLSVYRAALGAAHPDVGETLLTLGEARLAVHDPAAARAAFDDTRAIAKQTFGTEHLLYARALSGEGRAMLESGNAKDALALLREAATKYRSLVRLDARAAADESADRFRAFAAATIAAWDAGGHDAALAEETLTWAQLGASTAAETALVQQAARLAAPTRAIEGDVRVQQDLAEQIGAAEASLYLAASRTKVPAGTKDLDTLRARLGDLKQQMGNVSRRIDSQFPQLKSYLAPEPIGVAEIQSRLRDTEALVAFLIAPASGGASESVFTWTVSKTGPAYWARVDRAPGQTATDVAALRCGLDKAAWRDAGEARCASLLGGGFTLKDAEERKSLPFGITRALALYRALFGGVESQLKNVDGTWKDLLIVPSGALTQIPFQVLVTDDADGAGADGLRNAAWLARRHAITVLPSVASLKALRGQARPSEAKLPMLTFANPVLDGDERGKAPADLTQLRLRREAARYRSDCALPKSTAEAQLELIEMINDGYGLGPTASAAEIRGWDPAPGTAKLACDIASAPGFEGSETFLAGTATEGHVKALNRSGDLARYHIIHFATHGALADEVAGIAEPGLVLTPTAGASSSEDDGFLTASEITDLKLDADWVILSACNTAAGGERGGEALSGLARAFFFAQARALLVSHRSVYEQAAVKLVTSAVRSQQQDGTGRAEALRRAMVDLIDQGSNREAHPGYWAPFVVVGEGAARR